MKKITLLSMLFVVLIGVYYWQQLIPSTHAYPSNPPTGMTGQSGSTCGNGGCHTPGTVGMGAFGTDLTVTLMDLSNNVVSSYVPGNTYNVTVSNSASFVDYGFAMSTSSSNDSFISGAGTSTANGPDGQEIHHGSVNTSGTWSFQWQAPASGEGDINFYIGAIGGNGANGENGETWYQGSFTVSEATVTATVEVTFLLDGTCLSAGATPYIAGDFQGWDPALSPMVDSNSDGVWEATFSIEEGTTVQFKYLTAAGWGNDEGSGLAACGVDNGFGGFNRSFTVPTGVSAASYGPYAFNSCETCPVIPPAEVNVTFYLDGNCNGVTTPYIAGSFQGWEPTTSPMTDADGDGIWEATFAIAEGSTVEFKFLHDGAGWGSDESVDGACGAGNGNRTYTVPTGVSDASYGPYAFGSCEACPVIPPAEVNVTFYLDGNCNGVTTPYIAGSFQGWEPTTSPMTDADGDGIWEATFAIAEGSTVEFKFLYDGAGWGSDESVDGACGAGNGNRTYTVPTGVSDASYGPYAFGSCEACPVCTASSGEISTEDATTFCVTDEIADLITVNTTDAGGENYMYVVTDENGIILAISESNVLNFTTAEPGVCLIWGLSYDGTLSGLEVGADAFAVAGECFDFSNAITVTRQDCTPICEANAGEISLENTLIPYGGSNEAPTVSGANENYAYAFVLTTDVPDNETMFDIVDYNLDGVFSFEGLPAGTYYIHGISIAPADVTAAITALSDGSITSGEAALAAIDAGIICADLIVPGIEITVEEEVIVECNLTAGNISTESATTFCVGDGEADIVNIAVEGSSEGTYVYVVTDEAGNILAISESAELNFDEAAPGICLIWGLVHDGTLGGAEVGANAADLTGCFDLTDESIAVTRQDCTPTFIANAGTITTEDETTLYNNDAQLDMITVIIDGAGEGGTYQFIVTDSNMNIVAISSENTIDFAGYAVGQYQIWGIHYDGDMSGFEVGANAGNIAGNYDLSNAINVTVLEEVLVDCSGFTINAVVLPCTEAQQQNGYYSVEITWTGGEGPYTLDGTVSYETYTENSIIINDLSDNTEYSLFVVDANGCFVSVTDAGYCAKCTAFSVAHETLCNEAGTAYDLTITINGTPPYNFEGDYQATGYNSNVLVISNLTAGTTYTIDITDSKGCNDEITGTNPCKLDVDLLRFGVALEGEDVLVNWATATEENSAYFIVERSQDGINFSEVGRLDAAGDSHSVLAYAFTDKSVQNCETYYYRLKEVDVFGEEVIVSKVEQINTLNKDCLNVNVAPVPTSDKLIVTLSSGVSSDINISIYDVLGREVKLQNEKAISGENIYIVEVEDLASGAYFINVRSGANVSTLKFVKK
ncbi:MAG: T9SS type A sorting domain-containing protein [Chitinophagales bacterium]|nr:T9SS type A sorting domain-containing protein [Chitinophagales bacterium]